MGAIQERMIGEMQLRGMAPKTKKSYLVCCRVFVAYFMKSPEQLGTDNVKTFLLHLVRERKAGPSTLHVYIAALCFLYRHVLGIPGVVDHLPRPRIPIKLPDVLDREEVHQLLAAVRSLKLRTILTTAYAAGLRISEALRLEVRDIDSKRMVIHIRSAKNGKDRLVLLSPELLAKLRLYWVESRPRGRYLFPGRNGQPVHIDVIRRALQATVREVGIKKRVTLHSFRHGFATHLLEDGTDVRVIQALLGHSNLATTAHYTQVSTRNFKNVTSPLDRLTRPKNDSKDK
jgi:integrase/recombinase XerD